MKAGILAFGAHPDDVELSCGGTLLKNIAEGKSAGIIDLTKGELGTRGTVTIRKKEAAEAARILGVAFRENLGLPDGFFSINKTSLLKIVRKIRQYQPKVVLTPALEDRHPDHGRASQLITEACFLAGLQKIATTFKGKKQRAFRPEAVYHYIQYRKLKPDFAVDITRYMDKKMEAIRAFRSQFYDPNSKESATLISDKAFLDYISQREEEYGRLIGTQYAEGFNVAPEASGTSLI